MYRRYCTLSHLYQMKKLLSRMTSQHYNQITIILIIREFYFSYFVSKISVYDALQLTNMFHSLLILLLQVVLLIVNFHVQLSSNSTPNISIRHLLLNLFKPGIDELQYIPSTLVLQFSFVLYLVLVTSVNEYTFRWFLLLLQSFPSLLSQS